MPSKIHFVILKPGSKYDSIVKSKIADLFPREKGERIIVLHVDITEAEFVQATIGGDDGPYFIDDPKARKGIQQFDLLLESKKGSKFL